MTGLHPEVFAEIDLADGLVVDELVGRARGEHFAFVDDVGVVADRQGFADVVVGDQNADVALLEEAHDALNLEYPEC